MGKDEPGYLGPPVFPQLQLVHGVILLVALEVHVVRLVGQVEAVAGYPSPLELPLLPFVPAPHILLDQTVVLDILPSHGLEFFDGGRVVDVGQE